MELALLLLATLASARLHGDTGKGSEVLAKAIARIHAEATIDAILLTGDNFYPCGVESADDPRGKAVPEAQIHTAVVEITATAIRAPANGRPILPSS